MLLEELKRTHTIEFTMKYAEHKFSYIPIVFEDGGFRHITKDEAKDYTNTKWYDLNLMLNVFNNLAQYSKNTSTEPTITIENDIVKCVSGDDKMTDNINVRDGLDKWLSRNGEQVFPKLDLVEVIANTKEKAKDKAIASFQRLFLAHLRKNVENSTTKKIHLKNGVYQWAQGYWLVETTNKDYVKGLEAHLDDNFMSATTRLFDNDIIATLKVNDLKEFLSKLKSDSAIEMKRRCLVDKDRQFYPLLLNGKLYGFNCKTANAFFSMLPERDSYKFEIRGRQLVYESDDYKSLMVSVNI